MEIRITRARKVFSDGKHNAFTGIASFKDTVYIVFRSAVSHVSFDGAVRVIASDDMDTWSTAVESSMPGLDLRDPKVAAFNRALHVYCGARDENGVRHSMVSSSPDGCSFSQPTPVQGVPAGHWLWAVKPHEDRLYGTAYRTRSAVDAGADVAFYGSSDGTAWERIADFPVPGSEVSIDFDEEGVLWALMREDGRGSVPAVCSAEPPYTAFRSVLRPPVRLQGPMVKRLPGGCVLVGRRWDAPGRRNLRTDVFWLEDGRDIRLVRSLPSGGDTSYPGWLDVGEGRGVMSYYSSHEHKMDEPHSENAAFLRDGAHAEHSTPADIFLADVSYA